MNNTPYDLVIRNGNIVSNGVILQADLGIRNGIIEAISPALEAGLEEIDADGQWVLPGGIDSHCHVEQRSGMGMMCADDFYSATVSAAFGGTTTIIPFAAQHRGQNIPDVLADYHARAKDKAVTDYGFHLIVTNPDERTLQTDLPQAIKDGVTSLKVYMTYEQMRVDDYQLLEILDLARHQQALVMLHAENHDMIRWITKRLLDRGHSAPKFYGVAHDPLAENEATNRAITFSRLLDAQILIVHVSDADTVEQLRHAQRLGARVMAESCPQYLFLKSENMDLPDLEGAKFCCSPPLRDGRSQAGIWQGFLDGTLATYSSDHATYRFDETGKLPKGDKTTFKEMANGLPGLELRLPLLFSEGVVAGKMDIHEFVALTSTNHANIYGLSGRKGELIPGADADIAIWDPRCKRTISYSMLHDNAGYTPYEGREITGWPVVVISQGRVVVRDEKLSAARGTGRYLRRGPSINPTRVTQGSIRKKQYFLDPLVKTGNGYE